jgi:deferrochelatase/peroxidase EfeB
MSCPFSGKGAGPTRRGLLVGAGGALASAGVATLARAAPQASQSEAELRELFFGPHQGGIATPQQTHSYFAAFDCLAKSRDELVTMLKVWTDTPRRECRPERPPATWERMRRSKGRMARPRSGCRPDG